MLIFYPFTVDNLILFEPKKLLLEIKLLELVNYRVN